MTKEQASFTQTAATWAMLSAGANIAAMLMMTGLTMTMPNGEKLQKRMGFKGTAAATLALGTTIVLAVIAARAIVPGFGTGTPGETYPAKGHSS